MDSDPILSIKQRLVDQPEDYVDTALGFFDLFGRDRRFRGKGVTTVDVRLSRLVEELCQQQIGVRVQPGVFRRLPEVDLLHGGFRAGRSSASVFYFTDIGVGVLFAIREGGRKPESRMVRFEGEFSSVAGGS